MVFLKPTVNSNGVLAKGVDNVKLTSFLKLMKDIEIDKNSKDKA
jgi:hypothetical protein